MGSSNTTTRTVSDPWKPVQPALSGAIPDIQQLYSQGGFSADPYQGPRVAGFGGVSNEAQNSTLAMARGGAPAIQAATGTITGMMNPQMQSQQLAAVQKNALGAAIPSAVSQFSGSGMTNSTQAMDTVGRAATDAVAPYAYDAFNQSQNRSLQAAGMAPAMTAAGYIPQQMMAGVGADRDAMRQSQIDAQMAKYYEGQGQDQNNLSGYLNSLMGVGGMGGMQSQRQPGPSFGVKAGSSLAGGLGTYGMLAGIPGIGPFAALGGLGAGLMGLL